MSRWTIITRKQKLAEVSLQISQWKTLIGANHVTASVSQFLFLDLLLPIYFPIVAMLMDYLLNESMENSYSISRRWHISNIQTYELHQDAGKDPFYNKTGRFPFTQIDHPNLAGSKYFIRYYDVSKMRKRNLLSYLLTFNISDWVLLAEWIILIRYNDSFRSHEWQLHSFVKLELRCVIISSIQ